MVAGCLRRVGRLEEALLRYREVRLRGAAAPAGVVSAEGRFVSLPLPPFPHSSPPSPPPQVYRMSPTNMEALRYLAQLSQARRGAPRSGCGS